MANEQFLEGSQALWRAGERLKWVLTPKFGKPEVRNVADMIVVDLGCGSPQSSDTDYGGENDEFAANFSRLCAKYGASRVIGIDYYPGDPADAGVYEHIQANLVDLLGNKQGLIELCERLGIKGKVNLLHTNQVLESASRIFVWSTRGIKDSGILLRNLKHQAGEILAEGGILAINDRIYIKEKGRLVLKERL